MFDEDKQRRLAHLFASLLSPVPGSIIFGFHIGASNAEEDKLGRDRLTFLGKPAFAHSPISWRELWSGTNGPFRPEQVSIEVEISQTRRAEPFKGGFQDTYRGYFHIWSITRI